MNKNNTIRVGYDLDGTLANFVGAWTELASKYFTEAEHVEDGSELKTYNLSDKYGAHITNAVWKHIKNEGAFYNRLEPLNKMWLEDVKQMEARQDIETHYVTSRAHETVAWYGASNNHERARLAQNIREQTENWLDRHGLAGRLHMKKDKGIASKHIPLDFYLDNKVEDVMDAQRKSPTQSYLLDKKYNREADVKRRVQTVTEFNDEVRGLVSKL